MAEDKGEAMSDLLLVQAASMEYLLAPVKKATRLKYNCVSVSPRLVALGSNTGGIYLFSRSEEKLVQIAFAEKETNAVVMVQLSPNEKFVGFVSSVGTIHVLELKLETKSKPETVRSTSDLGAATATTLFWDPASTRLYVGDDHGRVSMIPVSSNKAVNLFSAPLEVILKLDSAIVQIDKADDKLLVSTLKCCYLCNTSKQTYSQIGKKLRDGHYGACFLTQGSDTAMIYCARPGSRIWEVDATGSVLNTHQFKQLLAVPPTSVFVPDRSFPGLLEGTFAGQAVNFPKLKILGNNLLLTWNQSTVFILDPVNVKVILWSNQFSGILDVICLHQELFIFQQTMELAHVSVSPVAEVVSLCLGVNNMAAAAKLCLAFKNVLHHKHVRKKLGLPELEKLYDNLMDSELYKLGEAFQAMMHEVESKTALDSSSESGRSRSSSVVSSLSGADVHVQETSKLGVGNAGSEIVVSEKDAGDLSNNGNMERFGDDATDSFINVDLNVADVKSVEVLNIEKKLNQTEDVSENTVVDTVNDIMVRTHSTSGDDKCNKIDQDTKWETNVRMNGDVVNESSETDSAINIVITKSSPQTTHHIHHDSSLHNDSVKEDSLPSTDTPVIRNITKQPVDIVEDLVDKISLDESSKDSGISEMRLASKDSRESLTEQAGLLVEASGDLSSSPAPSSVAMETGVIFEEELDDDDISDLRSRIQGSRRSSLTSLSSFDSAEVTMDQLQTRAMSPQGNEPIAVSVRRKSSRRKKRLSLEESRRSLEESSEKGKGILTRRQSTGSFTTPFSRRDRMLSPTGSLQEPIEERLGTVTQSEEDLNGNRDQLIEEKNADTVSLNSVLSTSGEFGQSGMEIARSGEWSQSAELSPTTGSPLESWETGSQDRTSSSFPSTSRAKLMKMKDRMQTTVTSKTKNLIRNIKEKNLLTKAKVLAENFAQPSDSFPLGEGFYVEPIDTQFTRFDTETKETRVGDAPTDDTDSLAQCLVDIGRLQEKTEQTRTRLQDMADLMNPGTVRLTLLDWLTVLNQTFQELHVKMYTQSSVYGTVHGSGEEKTETKAVNEVLDNSATKDMDSERLVQKDDVKFVLDGKVSTVDRGQEAELYGATILKDSDFCYINDPLNLEPKIFKDVCELVQACFDIDAHGDILNYRDLRKCSLQKSADDTRDDTVSEHEAKGKAATMHSGNCDISNLNSNVNHDGGGLEALGCDKDECSVGQSESPCDEMNKPCIENELREKNKDGAENNFDEALRTKQKEETEVENIFEGFEDENVDDDIFEVSSTRLDKSDEAGDCDTGERGQVCDSGERGQVCNSGERGQVCDSGERGQVCDSGETTEERDQAMGFFVRCYFPYLSLARLRDRLLRETQTFHTWSAFVACLQVLVLNDSDKYGVQKGSVIDHLLDTRYHGDGGALLLGHLSRLIRDSDSAAMYTCVKCHPYIQPVDVLYMCRLHSVAMETVFKQYMMQMVQQASRTLRGGTELGLYSHVEVRCVWAELLMQEEEDRHTLVDGDGKPRLFGHTHQWKHQLYIENVLSVESSPDDMGRLLSLCTKFGYWRGVLRLTKRLGLTKTQLETILHLGDLDLISSYSELGYLPSTAEEWESLITDHLALLCYHGDSEKGARPRTITLEGVSLLLVQHLGPEAALALLDRLGVPEGALSAEFYQSCLLAAMVQKHQRCVLHSMLEKVDSYLWSQRPATLSPQLHYLAVQERDVANREPGSSLHDTVQALTSQLRESDSTEAYIEDPECHWGVETRINLLCLCCNIPLKEPVSHEESGVLLFRCGHGYHKLCLPERECLLCD